MEYPSIDVSVNITSKKMLNNTYMLNILRMNSADSAADDEHVSDLVPTQRLLLPQVTSLPSLSPFFSHSAKIFFIINCSTS